MSEQVSKQAITYRVRGDSIPVDGAKEWLINVLRARFAADESDIIKKVKPIPSVTRSGGRCGLLWLKRSPAFLAGLEKDETSEVVIDLEDDEGTLTFDRHFYGLTQLYDTTPGDPILADIVAISGLDGHAFGSWREKGNIGQMWLTDWLPKDLPHCRVMTYGYNCKIQANMRPIREYGEAIGEALRKARKNEDERNRPLIFMGHSFGGLLAAHTLVRAHTYDTPGRTDPLYSCIYGFVFFGTPHRGLKTDTFKQMMPKDVDPVLLDTIAKDSEFLESMHENFKTVLGERKVLSFYEGRGTKSLVKDEVSQKWGRTGDRELMVTKTYSTLGIPGERTLPCDADHSFMVKLSDKDGPTYTSIISILAEWQGQAPEVVSALNSYISNETQQEEMYAIMNNLSPFAFEQEPRDIIKDKYPSADEFLQSGSFLHWCDHDKPTSLECHGQPDSGKTVRAAFVAQHLFDLYGHKPVLEKAVFYLRLDKHPQGSMTIEKLLGSLLRQLTYLRQSVSTKIGKLAHGLTPTIKELREILIFETKRLSRVFIIIDGWDQCSDDIRLALKDEMTFLTSNNIKLSQMRIRQSLEPRDVVCCDMEDCQAQNLGVYYRCYECDRDLCRKCKSNGRTCLDNTHKLQCIALENDDIEFGTSRQEIYKYIMFMLQMDLEAETKVNAQDSRLVQRQNLSKLGSVLRTDRELLESIPARILDTAALSWKWARTSIESLRTRHSPEQVREDLEQGFPDAIQHFYDDEMIEIFDQPKSDVDLARKVLSILTYSYEKIGPMGMEILRHAMAIKEVPNTFDLQPDVLITSDWILLVTKGLLMVQIVGGEEKVDFNHESIADYLKLNEKRWIPTAKIDVANICLRYLSLTPFYRPSTSIKQLDLKIRQYPFVAYAAEFWGEHIKDALDDNDHTDADMDAAMRYLDNNNAAFVQLAWHTSYKFHGWDVYKSVTGVHICAWYGLEKLVERYLNRGASLDTTEGTYSQTPLFYACRNGHAETARLLVKAGANVNHVSKKGKTPLIEAVERDRLTIVKLLMDEAEDLDSNKVSKKRLRRSALMIAAGRKNFEIVEYLSRHKDKPVDLNMEDTKGLTALQIAIVGSDNDCEDISNETGHYETPDDPERQLKTVALLLKHRKKIDINHVESTKGRSAVSIAAIYGEVDIVQSLLKKKADPNLADRDGVSPAMHAARRRYFQVVKALLEKTDSDVADKHGRYLIHFAAMSGSCDILAFLCGRHANLNVQDDQGFTPLHYTARYNHVEASEFLLKRGASVKLQDKFNRTPMRLSWQYGQYAITELFQHMNAEEPNLHIDKRPSWSLGFINTGKEFKPALENLKDKNNFDDANEPGTGNTLLHIAAHHHDDEMKMLRQVLEHPISGLDINKQNNDGHTPLHIAVQYGNIDGVQTLIEHGALRNITDKWGRTPFSLAYELALENGGRTKQTMMTIMLVLHSPEDLKKEDQSLLELFYHACRFDLHWAVEKLMKEYVDEGTTFAKWCKRRFQYSSYMQKILQGQDSYHTIKDADDSDSDDSQSENDSDDEDQDYLINDKKLMANRGVSKDDNSRVVDGISDIIQGVESTGTLKDVSNNDSLEDSDDEFNVEWDVWPITLDLVGLMTTGTMWFASYGSVVAEAMVLL